MYVKSLCIGAILFSIFHISKANSNNDHAPEVFHVVLDREDGTTQNWTSMNWIVDYNKRSVWFEIVFPLGFRWFAFGFSDRGEAFPADYCVLWYDWKGHLHFQDTWVDKSGKIHIDINQNCLGFDMKQENLRLIYTYHRKFDTCDRYDYIIEDGTIHLVWARGKDLIYHLDGFNVSVSKENSGMARVQLLKNTDYITDLPPGVQEFDLLADKVNVPAEETTYWCHIHKLPDLFKRKHHILQYVPHITNDGLVHHMELFHCIAPLNQEIPMYIGSCFDKDRPDSTLVCKRVLAAWAMGANGFTYPEEAALPIGGEDFNRYMMLEIHYNNPQKLEGIVDSSGIRLYFTANLRPMDAGVIELGLEYTDKMAIPPGQFAFPLTGYCVSECTAISLPPEGITIFGSQLHTHLTGVKVVTRHFRDGIELPELNRDDHYSTHFQEIRRLKRFVHVLPGDSLITTCYYNTEDRENVTLGGFSISDEMCVNYLHYFPSTALEVCKSAISDDALDAYFRYMLDWESQRTYKDNPISTNYNMIEWNKMRVQLLMNVYNESPLGMQCNMSSGDRFPGYWDNTPQTRIYRPLPPHVRLCPETK